MKTTAKGHYTNIELDENGNLVISATREAKKDRERFLEMYWEEAIFYLLEDHFCNAPFGVQSLEWIGAEEVGALTSSPILSDCAIRDDDGKLQSVEYVWWFPDYAVKNEIEEILNGKCVFTRIEEEE